MCSPPVEQDSLKITFKRRMLRAVRQKTEGNQICRTKYFKICLNKVIGKELNHLNTSMRLGRDTFSHSSSSSSPLRFVFVFFQSRWMGLKVKYAIDWPRYCSTWRIKGKSLSGMKYWTSSRFPSLAWPHKVKYLRFSSIRCMSRAYLIRPLIL